MRAQYPSILTLSLAERPQMPAPLLPTLLVADDPHLGFLLPIVGDPEAELGGLLQLVGAAGEAPADNGRQTVGRLEGETGGGERQADQSHSGSDLGRSWEADQTWGERYHRGTLQVRGQLSHIVIKTQLKAPKAPY